VSRDTFATETPPPADDVLVVDTRPGREGQRLYIPSAELPTAIERFGVRLATAEEAAESERQRVLGGGAGEAATAAMAAADELSLGAVSRGATEAGPGAAQARTALTEINPTAQTVGTVGGALALGAATTGLGAITGIGRGAGAVARIGRGVAEGVAAGAAGGAATLEQQLAADPSAQLTAERIAGTVGVGGLIGGALGGAIDGLLVGGGELGRRLLRSRSSASTTREATGAVVERALGREPAPGVVDAVLERVGRAGTAGLDDEGRAFVQRALRPGEEGRQLRAAIDAGDSIVDDVTREARRQLDDLDQLTRATEDFSKGELKRGQVRRLVRDDAIDLVAEEGAGQFASLRALAQQIEGDTAIAGGKGFARRMTGAIDEYEAQFARAVEQGGADGAADALIALDRMKRRLGTYVESVTRSPDLRIVAQEFEGAYEQLRVALEREDLFGGAAAAQREINAAWSPLIKRRRVFDRTFRTETGEADGFRSLRGADSAKINSWLQNTGTARASSQDDLFSAFVEEQSQFLQSVARHYDLPDDVVGAIGAAQRVTSELQETLGRVRTSVAARNQLREVSSQLADRDGLLGGILSPITGGLVGGAPGAVVGAALSAVRRPDQIIRMMASLERMGLTFEARQGAAISAFVKSVSRTGSRAGSATRALRNAGAVLSGQQVAERYNRAVETLTAVGDPQALLDRLQTTTARIGDRAPEHAAHLTATVARATTFLASRIPPGAMQPPTVGAPALTPADLVPEEEQREFLRIAAVVDDPLTVLDDAAAGTLTREQVEALWAVYPAMAQSMTVAVTESIADRSEPLPYEGRVSVSLLLGVATDPSLRPDAVRRAQETFEPPAEDGSAEPLLTPGNRRPPQIAAGFATEAQGLAARS
jgi:hypothetical protein